jgi:uncharacterized membrane protein
MHSSATKRPPFLVNPWRSRLVAFGLAGVTGAGVMLAAPAWLHGTIRAVAAYDTGSVVLLGVFWFLAMHSDPQSTLARASIEDPPRNAVLGVVLISVAVALWAAVSILGRGPHVATPHEKAIAYGVGIAAVAIGWTLIHTMFTFRYAHLFYYVDGEDNEADRGLMFPGTTDPNDFDFAYLSFGIGTTFQVSDVQVTDRGIRRVVLFQSIVSFVYNSTILALLINIVSGLLH